MMGSKNAAIIIYLDILFTRSHSPGWGGKCVAGEFWEVTGGWRAGHWDFEAPGIREKKRAAFDF